MGAIVPYLIGGAIVAAGIYVFRLVGPFLLVLSVGALLTYGIGSGINAAANAVGMGNLFTFDSDIRREVARNSVLKTGFYIDDDVDYAHVYGRLTNNSKYPITHAWVECRLEVFDWSGMEEINVMGNVGRWKAIIKPGETVSFDVAGASVAHDARPGNGHCQLSFKVVESEG